MQFSRSQALTSATCCNHCGGCPRKVQSAVKSAGENHRQQLAARAEVQRTQHARRHSQNAARPRPRQIADEQRTEEAAQQVERRDGQRLVVVHILHTGDEQHGQHRADGGKNGERTGLSIIQSV